MMKRSVADDGIEVFLQREPVGVSPAVFHISCGALAAGDGEHGFGNVDGEDGIKAPGKFQGEQANTAAHVQHAAAAFGQMADEEIMLAFQGDEGVVRFRDMIEGSGVVRLHGEKF